MSLSHQLEVPYCTLCNGDPVREGERIVCGNCGAVLQEPEPDQPIVGYE